LHILFWVKQGDIEMDDDQDEFGALYGDVAETKPTEKLESASKQAAAATVTVALDDDDLFLQLYGDDGFKPSFVGLRLDVVFDKRQTLIPNVFRRHLQKT